MAKTIWLLATPSLSMTPAPLPSFDLVDQTLQNLGSVVTAPEVHGGLCGLTCVLGAAAPAVWGAQLSSVELQAEGRDPGADAVLSGGIRRSATICLFSPDDGEMMVAKTGNWYEEWPEYANSNNSVVLSTGTLASTATFSSARAISLTGAPGTFDVASGTTLTLNGVISGGGALTKTSAGTPS